MTSFWFTVIIAVVAVGLFAIGLSLTLIFRGHHIKSEIGENENLRERGIKCAIETMREEAGETSGCERFDRSAAGCTGCTAEGCGGGTHSGVMNDELIINR